jgi:hypothetical protein
MNRVNSATFFQSDRRGNAAAQEIRYDRGGLAHDQAERNEIFSSEMIQKAGGNEATRAASIKQQDPGKISRILMKTRWNEDK